MATDTIQVDGVEARPIPGIRGYFATRDGRIWSDRWNLGVKGRFRAFGVTPRGYALVTIDKKRFTVHRLVAAAFIGESDMDVRHLDGNKLNNRVENLTYGNDTQNRDDEVRLGRTVNGSRGHIAKLTDAHVGSIRRAYASGLFTQAELASKFGVSDATIGAIVRREIWKHLED